MGNSKSKRDESVSPFHSLGIPPYQHAHREMPYRSEKLEISSEEKKVLDDLLKSSLNGKEEGEEDATTSKAPTKVIFDTDIGTDVDDALALLLLLHLGDVELLGITTVYGKTQLRAAVAKQVVEAFYGGRGSPPVIAGLGVPLGTHRPVWHTGTEGIGLFREPELSKIGDATVEDPKDAAQFIVDQVMKYPGEVVLLSLGAMSNIALALQIEPKIASTVKRTVFMGMGKQMEEAKTNLYPFVDIKKPFEQGKVHFFYPNHNISCDTLAAVLVFRSGMPVSVINDTVTNQVWWDGEPCLRLMQAKEPVENEVVGRLLTAWLHYRTMIFSKEIRGTCPHDGLTTAEAIYPGKFVEYHRGHLVVLEWAGFSAFVLDPKGPHQIGRNLVHPDSKTFLQWFSSHLETTVIKTPEELAEDRKKY